MDTALATRPTFIDPSAGMELTTGDEIALEATRWLFLAGDMIDPHRKDELQHLAHGGEELANHCLRRTNGYLPRCTFTPMEVWAEWLPIEYFPEGTRPLKLKGEAVEDSNPTGRTMVGKPLFGFPHYPGELIVDAIGLATGEKKGVVELEALRGLDVGDAEVTRIQNLFFPTDYKLPYELRAVEERIHLVAAANSTDKKVQQTAKDMLTSCEQFRRWAEGLISRCHTQLDQRVSHQWTYSYTPKIRMLMAQLEISPRDTGHNPVDSLLTAMRSQGISPEMFEQMSERDDKLIEKLTGAFTSAMAEALKSVQSPPKTSK